MARVKEFNEIEALDKAMELFWEKGYNATSANDLVKKMGLSRSSLYSTYGDKRSLFIRSLDRYRERNVQAMLNMVKQSNNLPKTIEEIFKLAIEQDLTAKIPKGCLMVSSSIELAPHDERIAQIVAANEKNIESVFEAAITKGQEKGQISKEHSPKSLARFLFNSLSGLRVALKSKANKAILNDVVKVSLSVLK